MNPNLGPEFDSRPIPPGAPRPSQARLLPAEQMWQSGLLSDVMGHATQDLLRDGAFVPPAEREGPATLLPRTLSLLRDRFLAAQGLRGRVSYEAHLPSLEAPEVPLRSILEHLVEAALRENTSRSAAVHVGLASDADDHVTLLIRDNGPALPINSFDALRALVGNRSVAEIPDRLYRLYLADNLASWLGASLWMEPTEEEKGNTLYLRLPKGNAASAPRNSLVGRHVF